MSRESTEFELFVRAVYEEILAYDGYETVNVEHDVKLIGKSGQKHQIDVFWEFIVAGITHRVAVECKQYKNTVSVGKVRDFFAVLEDIGNIVGIFVTTKGYQSGAITYATHKGVALKTIGEPTQEDIDAHQGIKKVGLNMHALCIENVKRAPELDIDWILKNTSIKEGEEITLSGMSNEIKVVDSANNLIASVHDLEDHLPREPKNSTDLRHSYNYEDGFLSIPDSQYPLLKIKAFHFKYDTHTISHSTEIKLKLMAEAVLRDIITGESQLYKKRPGRDDA